MEMDDKTLDLQATEKSVRYMRSAVLLVIFLLCVVFVRAFYSLNTKKYTTVVIIPEAQADIPHTGTGVDGDGCDNDTGDSSDC
ncbi:MAG: hypothetical protein G01um101448_913 [Parcubacteria group bacterium Gr01-1014_48]|nr:MAG: hypothetical protein G01um101448_913 [Parcubacteria group bacterium Gr01-1014_48]